MNQSTYQKQQFDPKNCELCGDTFTPDQRYTRFCKKCTPTKRGEKNYVRCTPISCEICSKVFTPQSSLVKCCSATCGRERNRRKAKKPKLNMKSCAQCDKPYQPKAKNSKFCEQKCMRIFHARKSLERKKSGTLSKLLKIKNCTHCNSEFKPTNTRNKFCGNCTETVRRKAAATGKKLNCALCDVPFTSDGRKKYCEACNEKYPKNKPRKSKNPCEWCGKDFTHMRPVARFCSFSCSSTWLNNEGLGPKWSHDQLLETMVDFVKSRDHIVTLEEVGVVLGITHKVFSARDLTLEDVYTKAGKKYAHDFHSYFECRTYHALIALGIPESEIERQKTFPGLLGTSETKNVAYDFFLPRYNVLIEADGKQHYEAVYNEKSLEVTIEHDRRKNEFAKKQDITLIRFRYLVTFEEVVEELKKRLGSIIDDQQ